MGKLLRKVRKEEERSEDEPDSDFQFIDLAKYKSDKPRKVGRKGMMIRVAEVDNFDDLRVLSNYVYDGNILILDFTAIQNDELQLKRIISELKRLVEDIGGDLAGISQSMLVVTPARVSIDRERIRGGAGGGGRGGGGFRSPYDNVGGRGGFRSPYGR